jgi:transposase-like protein
MDESYFVRKRKGNGGKGAKNKILVFGIEKEMVRLRLR